MKKSWQTTTAGALTALGGTLVNTNFGPDSQWLSSIGTILTIIGPLWLGNAARDNKVSSEDVLDRAK